MPLAIKITVLLYFIVSAFIYFEFGEAVRAAIAGIIYLIADALQILEAYRSAENHFIEQSESRELLVEKRIESIEDALESVGVEIMLLMEKVEK